MKKFYTLLIAALAITSGIFFATAKNMNIYLKDGTRTRVVVADVDSIDFTEPAYFKISAPAGSGYTLKVASSAEEGTVVTATVVMEKESKKPDGLYYVKSDSEDLFECDLVEENGLNYTFQFTMPKSNITMGTVAVDDNHKVTRHAENAEIALLNCVVDQDDLDRREEKSGEQVKFNYTPALGYSLDKPTVTGDDSRQDIEVWYDTEADDQGYPPCWKFVMPDEPVTINVVATENTDYKGKYFTGSYAGYQIAAGEDNITSGDASLQMSLNGNASYTVATSDANNYNFSSLYTFDERAKTFAYVANSNLNAAYGINGQRIDGGDTFVFIRNLINDTPDNVRYYFATQEPISKYTCAATSSYATNCLLEIVRGSKTTYYWFERDFQKATEVTVDFQEGSSIGGNATAIVAYGNDTYKYEHAEGSAPTFTKAGSERGSYSGEQGEMTLDGFGNITLGDQTGTYTINGYTITTTIDGLSFKIDTTARTYESVEEGAWDGPLHFRAEGDNIGCAGGTIGKGTISIDLNQDFSGNETEGKAKLVIDVYVNGKAQSIDAYTYSYEYDATAKTITIIGTYVSTTPGGAGSDLVFNVSDDKQSLTAQAGKLYGFYSSSTYIDLTGTPLTAVTE